MGLFESLQQGECGKEHERNREPSEPCEKKRAERQETWCNWNGKVGIQTATPFFRVLIVSRGSILFPIRALRAHPWLFWFGDYSRPKQNRGFRGFHGSKAPRTGPEDGVVLVLVLSQGSPLGSHLR